MVNMDIMGPKIAELVRSLKKARIKADIKATYEINDDFDRYSSDLTRCVFFGEKDPFLEKIYEVTKKAQKKALSFCKPGIKIKTLDDHLGYIREDD